SSLRPGPAENQEAEICIRSRTDVLLFLASLTTTLFQKKNLYLSILHLHFYLNLSERSKKGIR
ncbi:unnamed protein product, partial [Amoebophrya sp. A120]